MRLGPHQEVKWAVDVDYPLHRYRQEYWDAINWSRQVRLKGAKRNLSNDPIAQTHLRWLKRGIHFDRANPQSYASVALIYLYYFEDTEQALEWAFRSLNASPFVPDMTDAIALIRRIQLIKDQKTESFFQNLEKNDNDLFLEISHHNERMIWKWAESDIEKMVKIIRKHNVKLVILDYPPIPRTPFQKREIDNVLEKVSKRNQIPFLSIYNLFSHLGADDHFMQKHYWEQFGVLDEHPNGAGYKVIAEEVYAFIMNERLL